MTKAEKIRRASQHLEPWPHTPSGAWLAKAIRDDHKEVPRKYEKNKLAKRGLIRTQKSRI